MRTTPVNFINHQNPNHPSGSSATSPLSDITLAEIHPRQQGDVVVQRRRWRGVHYHTRHLPRRWYRRNQRGPNGLGNLECFESSTCTCAFFCHFSYTLEYDVSLSNPRSFPHPLCPYPR
jgi:hypothetical protein